MDISKYLQNVQFEICVIFTQNGTPYESKKDTQVIRVRGSAAPRVFELELLVWNQQVFITHFSHEHKHKT